MGRARAEAFIAQRGFFATPRGLGLATATTSASFMSHWSVHARTALNWQQAGHFETFVAVF
jgi:hypothetical protein